MKLINQLHCPNVQISARCEVEHDSLRKDEANPRSNGGRQALLEHHEAKITRLVNRVPPTLGLRTVHTLSTFSTHTRSLYARFKVPTHTNTLRTNFQIDRTLLRKHDICTYVHLTACCRAPRKKVTMLAWCFTCKDPRPLKVRITATAPHSKPDLTWTNQVDEDVSSVFSKCPSVPLY